MRLKIVVAAYAIWLIAIFGVFYLVHGIGENALQFTLISGLIPVACQIFLLGVDWRGLAPLVRLWLIFLLVILLSYLLNGIDPLTAPSGEGSVIPAAWMPIVYTVNTVFVMAIGTLVAGCPDRRLLRSIAGLFCVLTAPFLVYVDLTGERVWGRLSANDLQPNMWGLIGLIVCLGAFARKPGVIALVCFLIGTATILEASSRESLVALAAAVVIYIGLYSKTVKGFRLYTVLAGSCVMLLVAIFLLDPYILNAIHYVNSDVLLLNSPERGLGSGFTGRSGVWTAAIELWLKSPLIGIGFRQHELFLDGWPAHNAFLAMLADTGVVGLVVYLVLLITSLVASWGIRDQRTRCFVVTVIVAYIVSGFFDRRTINGGNPYSLFFVMCCSVALADQSLRKAAARFRKVADGRRDFSAVDAELPAR